MAYRQTFVEVNLSNIAHNIKTYQKKLNKEVIAVIKANAYGIGDLEVAKVAIDCGVTFLAVSSLDEAMHLRNNNINTKILVLGYVDKKDLKIALDNDIRITITSMNWLKECINDLRGITLHLKVNTGMNRLGVTSLEQINEALTLLKGYNVEGIFTHLAMSDQSDNPFNQKQIKLFEELLEAINYNFEYIHISNSDATYLLDEKYNAIRLGVGLFGYASDDKDLKPAISLKTEVANIQRIAKDEAISYQASYTLKEDAYIITLPIGYADGVDLRHQNQNVYINGEYGKIVGRICMDMLMVEVNKPYKLNTEVELFGQNISLKDYANRINVIPYVILVSLSERLMKKYYLNNELILTRSPRFER